MGQYIYFINGIKGDTITANDYTHALEKVLGWNGIVVEEVDENGKHRI